MKRILAAILCLVMIVAVAAAMPVNASADDDPYVYMALAHNMAEDHAVNKALTQWAQDVYDKSNGSIEIEIFFGGTLGSETECLQQVQQGTLEMTKVSAGSLDSFVPEWNALSVPYVFNDRDHLYKVMNSDIAQDMYMLSEDQGFVGLTWLESGVRCFYTKNTPIRTPSDLKGLKIRTMQSQMAIAMMKAFDASSTSQSYSEAITAMSTGVIDGAENNVTALRDFIDCTKYYCYDEHTMIPDIIVISSNVWNSLTDNQKKILQETAVDMTANYRELWASFEDEVIQLANDKGIEFITDVDKAAFQDAVKGIYTDLEKDSPSTYEFVKRIQEAG